MYDDHNPIEHYNIINMKTVNISRAAYAIMLTLMLINKLQRFELMIQLS